MPRMGSPPFFPSFLQRDLGWGSSPLMNSYVSMRLLLYSLGEPEAWKRRELRGKDFLEEALDLH